MREVVWVSEWEWACCGTPFTVGGTVEWTVARRREGDDDDLADLLGDLGREVGCFETHHDQPTPDRTITGRVLRIRAASCVRASTARNPVQFDVVPGTLELRELAELDRDLAMAHDADEEFTDLEGRPIAPAPPPRPEEMVRFGGAGEVRLDDGTGQGWFGAVRSERSRIPRRHRGIEGYLVDLETPGE